MEIVVDEAGVPMSADLVMTVVATDGSVTATFVLNATYLISDWEAVEPIEPPI